MLKRVSWFLIAAAEEVWRAFFANDRAALG
jgi:hypothetical protein